MTSLPDQLFRDGLGKFQKKPPLSAWERIESGLDRKEKSIPWLKIAAGLLLLIVTSMLLWQQTRHDDLPALSQSTKQQDAIHLPLPANKGQEIAHTDKDAIISSQPDAEPENTVSKRHQASGVRTQNRTNPEIAAYVTAEKPDTLTTTAAPSPDEISITMQDEHAVAATDRTNITYTANEVNSKFLKKDVPVEATPERKNTSGLQKVIAVAMDLKYEESLVGELREKKNEWLSFTPSGKKKTLNK